MLFGIGHIICFCVVFNLRSNWKLVYAMLEFDYRIRMYHAVRNLYLIIMVKVVWNSVWTCQYLK